MHPAWLQGDLALTLGCEVTLGDVKDFCCQRGKTLFKKNEYVMLQGRTWGELASGRTATRGCSGCSGLLVLLSAFLCSTCILTNILDLSGLPKVGSEVE